MGKLQRVEELNRRLRADLGETPCLFQWKHYRDLLIMKAELAADGSYRPIKIDWKPILSERYADCYILARQEDRTRGTLAKDGWVPAIFANPDNTTAYLASAPGKAPSGDTTSWAIAQLKAQRDQFHGKDLDAIDNAKSREAYEKWRKSVAETAQKNAEEAIEPFTLLGSMRLPGTKSWVSLPTPEKDQRPPKDSEDS